MLALYQVMICVGLFMAYGIDYGTEFIDGSASWRVPVGFQVSQNVTPHLRQQKKQDPTGSHLTSSPLLAAPFRRRHLHRYLVSPRITPSSPQSRP